MDRYLARSEQATLKHLISTLYLICVHALIWSVIAIPSIHIEEILMPAVYIFTTRQTVAHIKLETSPTQPFEAMFFSVFALAAYHYAREGRALKDMGNYYTALGKFQLTMMGIKRKYYWLLYMPWIGTFLSNWLNNLIDMIFIVGTEDFYNAKGSAYVLIVLLFVFFAQIILGSEIIILAYQGYNSMDHIHQANRVWEQRADILWPRLPETEAADAYEFRIPPAALEAVP